MLLCLFSRHRFGKSSLTLGRDHLPLIWFRLCNSVQKRFVLPPIWYGQLVQRKFRNRPQADVKIVKAVNIAQNLINGGIGSPRWVALKGNDFGFLAFVTTVSNKRCKLCLDQVSSLVPRCPAFGARDSRAVCPGPRWPLSRRLHRNSPPAQCAGGRVGQAAFAARCSAARWEGACWFDCGARATPVPPSFLLLVALASSTHTLPV